MTVSRTQVGETVGAGDRRESLRDLLIVDCDVHVHESPRALIPFAEPKWRTSLETIADIPERYLDIPAFSGGGDFAGGPAFPGSNPGVRIVEDRASMRRELDAIDVDIGILFPDHLLKLALIKNPEYAAALARAYNAWLVETWCRPDEHLLGVVIACPQDPENAAAEIERYADQPGIVGVYLPCAGIDPLWGDRRYHPIFKACSETGLPAMLHSVTVMSPVFPCNLNVFDNGVAIHGLGHTFSIMANLTSMVTTGVPVLFPELVVVSCEAGISWVPFLMNRLDKEYIERRREVPFLTERPSEYLKRWYYSTQPIEEPRDMADLAKMIDLYDGARSTVFASDWPHHDFDHPRKVAQIPVDNETRRAIMGENALRLFGIDRDARRNPR